MRVLIFTRLLFFSFGLFGQSFSESEISELANQVHEQIIGLDVGNGIIARGCQSIGRTLIYEYDVPSNWQPSVNMKKELVENLKASGVGETYTRYNIGVCFDYYFGDLLIERIRIASNEFASFSYNLVENVSIKGHSKSKGVNLKLKAPEGWQVKEGSRPNIVKKFTKDGNTYLILIQDNVTFFSRNEIREFLNDESFVNEFVEETSSLMMDSEVMDISIVTIDTYPSLSLKVRGRMERSGFVLSVIMRCWIVFYEDKVVFLQAMGNDNEQFRHLDRLYFLITNSVVFPEQYY